jgi:parallel beta-helix repeat protein
MIPVPFKRAVAILRTAALLTVAFLAGSDAPVYALSAPSNFYMVTEYYAGPNGSTNNSGLSPDSPWPLQYGLDQLDAGVTLVVLPGVYTGAYRVYRRSGTADKPAVVRSQQKWQAVIANSPERGLVLDVAQYIVVDGLCVSNSVSDGIKLLNGQNAIRNCWITRNGNTTDQQGISSNSEGCTNNIIEYNLVENNGASGGKGHGIYLSGANNIVRGNVVRNNGAFGIQLYTSITGNLQDNNRIYDNLVYGHTSRFGVTMWGAADPAGTPSGTNYLFNNTILDGVSLFYGVAGLTNNIILPSPISPTRPVNASTKAATRVTVLADYNCGTTAISPAGAHDVIRNVSRSAFFVNMTNGLYWLSATSPARSSAAGFATRDFFGDPQGVVTDIGALRYSDVLAGDSRNLENSSCPDYWAISE